MRFPRAFYRGAAVCSFLSAITTLLLIFLPRLYEPAEGFEGRMARIADPAYVWRSWVYLIHPFVVLMAALGVAASRRFAAPATATIGFLGFLLWAFTEAGQQAMTLAMFDRWRAAWSTAGEAARAAIQAQVPLYDGLWDAMYFLLIIGFAIGNLFFGLAMWPGERLARTVSVFYFAATLLTATILITEVGGPALPPALGFWLYPLIQPLGRALIGVWLWRFEEALNQASPS